MKWKNERNDENRVIRMKEICYLVGISRATIYLMIEENNFPKPLKIGKRAIGWEYKTIIEWIEKKHDEK
jgi:prophage regulatory protein